jgi:ABC-type nitrate/sulfonate/bicarbonate transport system ATPase subunit
MLEVQDVSVRYGTRRVLDRVSLTIAEGEVVALLGPSGSGKSTLLRVIAGLHPPDEGTVRWRDQDVTYQPAYRRRFGYVFQDEQLFPHLDVAANVGFGLAMDRRPLRDRRHRVEEMLDLVGLEGFGPRDVTTLSGGEAKRVALARALAPAPAVLLLDEPLSGLDTDRHEQLMGDLARLLREAKTTALLVTHDPAEATALADRTVRLADLGLVELSTADTHDLRRRVLRSGTPSSDVRYAQDVDPATVHLGLRRAGRIVAVSTWTPEPWRDAPRAPAVRLRGMAVDPTLQGTGLGATLVRAGLARAWEGGARVVWASARDSALDFYRQLEFAVDQAGFVDDTTGLPHHLIWLARPPHGGGADPSVTLGRSRVPFAAAQSRWRWPSR